MGVLQSIFTWWHGPGLGTRIFTRRHGEEVGRDDQGNIYYRSRASGRDGGAGERRWVIYNGEPEASRLPPDWQLWIRKTIAEPPSQRPLAPRVWERPWTPNATGTTAAHVPSGSLAAAGRRPRATGDYRAWTPDE